MAVKYHRGGISSSQKVKERARECSTVDSGACGQLEWGNTTLGQWIDEPDRRAAMAGGGARVLTSRRIWAWVRWIAT